MADLDKGKNPADLRWAPPTSNVDGSAISGPLSYNLYRKDPSDTDYVLFFVIVGELQTDGTYVAPIANFPEGSHEIVLTAVDSEGDESAYSNSVGFRIGVAPNPPVIL
ncbi:MAG: hypothetical protein ACYTKD_32530 [Planctomycetota bacterium]|jgi:hypothetical protein